VKVEILQEFVYGVGKGAIEMHIGDSIDVDEITARYWILIGRAK